MNDTVRIRAMNVSDIKDISAIHSAVLPTATARSGTAVLDAFYTTLLQSPKYQFAFVAEQDGSVVGAITGTLDSHRTSRMLSRTLVHPKVLISVIRSLIRGSISIREIIERKNTENALHMLTPPPYRTILTLVVAKNSQHSGIGSRLLKTIERSFPKNTVLCVDTEEKNTKARRFYEHNGFTTASRVHESILYTKQLP